MRVVLFSLAVIAGCLANDFPDLPPLPSSDAGEAAASSALTWPPDGAFGVPPQPELLAIRFPDDEEHAISLRVSSAPVTFEAVAEDCGEMGFEPGRCQRLLPRAPLPAEGTLTVHVDELQVASMSLGALDVAPGLAPTQCAVFERLEEGFCLDVDDRSARLRARVDRSARLMITGAGEARVFLAPGGRVDVTLPLTPGCFHDLAVEIVAIDGRSISTSLALVAERDLAPVHLSESLANPRGPEPAQEFVELINTSGAHVELGGFQLTDDEHRFGDVFPDDAFIPPHGRLLLVPRGYDPDDGRDPSPPPGALLLRLGNSLANAGLANSGEPLYLLDPRHRRVSSMPASPVPREGSCLLATSLDDRRPNVARFVVGACTPGR